MTQHSVATPVLNYVESEDLIFEIGDEDIETPKKKSDDGRDGYGFETEQDEETVADEDDDSIDEFEDFGWGEESEDE